MQLANQSVDLFGPVPGAPVRSLGAFTDDALASPAMRFYLTARAWLSPILIGAAAYHGYRRNHGSYGWAFGWGAFAAFAPVISVGVALAQGFGKPKKD